MAQSEGLGSNPRLMPRVSCAEAAWQDAVSQVHREQTASDTQPGAAPRPLRDKDTPGTSPAAEGARERCRGSGCVRAFSDFPTYFSRLFSGHVPGGALRGTGSPQGP